jgi:two-component system CheB/CheR fusion protein
MDDRPAPQQGQPLVVIGASAGGVEALMTLVASLPAEFPAPIVVAQHIERSRTSQLGEILGARSTLPVRTVTGSEELAPGTIFLVPAGRDVEIDDHHVTSYVDTIGPSRPSIDRLLATAARVYGDDLIAVILTGTGSDGTLGAQAVKAYGGIVIVQNPETAQFPGMPSSVSPLTVDIVADIEAIGPLLGDLLSGDYKLPGDETGDELRGFLGRVREQSGLDFGAYKRPTITRRLQRRMTAVGTATLTDYRRYVERHPDELQRLVASFLIKVTDFFRDPELFDYLRDQVLPKLISEARERGELRLWSAGCATGEEAYTLAMLVSDLLGGDTTSLPVRIFATDVAVDAVEFGRRGIYPEAALAGLPRDLVDRHFVQLDGVYEVRKSVRGLVVFGEHDLGHRAPFPRIDLVVCRNVLIYFTPELQRRALQLFAFSLRRGGALALGKAETVSPLPEYFALEQPRLKVYRRVGEPAPIPADQVLDPLPIHRAARRPGGRRLTPASPSVAPGLLSVQTGTRLLDELTVGIVTVDRNYHLQSINVAARRLLGIRSATLGEDLIHRVTAPLSTELRAVIDSALQGSVASTTIRVPRDVIEGRRDIAITCSPLRSSDPALPIEAALIEVTLVTPLVQRQRELEAGRDQALTAGEGMRADLEAAVAEVRELRLANEVMAAEQGRLFSENEQLQLATEEAQAATEEIETLNEELQATNEELETLNEELQATVEELTTTNDEMHAKSAELEALSVSLQEQHRAGEVERNRLGAILANMGDAVLVLDAQGKIVLTNAAYDRLFGGTIDFVPENDQGQPLPDDERPQHRATLGETFTLPFTLPGADGTRRWFEANAQPVPGTDGGQWSVIVFRDITERSLRRLQEEFLAIASHELRTPLTTLSGSLQLLQRRLRTGDADGRIDSLVKRSLDQTRRLQQHIAELMDVARLQGGRLRLAPEPFDLTEMVRQINDTADLLESEQTIRVTTPDHPIIYTGDAHRLQQVVFNLLTNAITHAAESEVIDLRLSEEPDAMIIEVQDYGPGVPDDKVPLLFSRFFQADEQTAGRHGLGLGLYIAREIVVAHGGDILVDSVVGSGTTFTVRLPNPPQAAFG